MSEALRAYRAHWRYLLAISLAVHVPLGAVALWLDSAGATSMVAGLVATVATSVMLAWLAAPVTALAAGRPLPSILGALAQVRGRSGALGAVTLVLAAVNLAGALAYGIPALLAAVWLAFVVPAVVLDGRRAEGAFRRSVSLVRGHAWPVFGLVLVNILLFALVMLPLLLASHAFETEFRWTGSWVVALFLYSPLMAMSFLFAFLEVREAKDAEPADVETSGATIERPA
jgi:hypothetical protein